MDQLRKYRFQFESPILNDQSMGIALFDLVGTFVVAYVIEETLTITRRLGISKELYYSSVVMVGIITHLLLGQNTFLNRKLMNGQFNIYKVLFVLYVVILVILIYNEGLLRM